MILISLQYRHLALQTIRNAGSTRANANVTLVDPRLVRSCADVASTVNVGPRKRTSLIVTTSCSRSVRTITASPAASRALLRKQLLSPGAFQRPLVVWKIPESRESSRECWGRPSPRSHDTKQRLLVMTNFTLIKQGAIASAFHYPRAAIVTTAPRPAGGRRRLLHAL
ncbi:hypothetical protein EVAR_92503_1 [Eumeta japonica]|uniref:Uncharacterized protein n=1 Tax=Eumeta variegata TaxID=151549 RepID=A0A4C1T6D4_EUMVA|nr:hypothetical protein EVAR_92503_1 [Eumeta japonica]